MEVTGTTFVRTVTAFVIKRSEWLRGEGPSASCLLREGDGKRCCVGLYARALGVPDAFVLEQAWPWPSASDRKRHGQRHGQWELSETDEAFWLMTGHNLSSVNDDTDPFLTNAAREAKIAKTFAENGITVTFEV